MKGNIPHSKNTQKILLFLLTAGVFIVAPSLSSKMARMLWGAVFKKSKTNTGDILPIYRLVRSNYIKVIKTKTETRIELTQRGKEIAQRFIYKNKHTQKRSWDRLWRVVMYDIPEKHKQERDALREKIKELGMYQLQKSVWVYPYNCKEEMRFLCDVLHVSYKKHILYFETKEIPYMNELYKIFGLHA